MIKIKRDYTTIDVISFLHVLGLILNIDIKTVILMGVPLKLRFAFCYCLSLLTDRNISMIKYVVIPNK